MKIPITKPYFTKDEEEAIIEPLRNAWVVQGPKVAEFEQLFAEYVGTRFALTTTSCTTALHLSLVALEIKEGDEVLVPSFTFVATANAVEYQKAKPVFVDIDINTFNIDPEKIEEKITHKTKAIIPVHLFGLPAEMTKIMEIAKRYNLKVVEDSACAVGSLYHGKHVGRFGQTGCFSFHPRKAISTGEGGMVVTDNEELAEKIKALRDHGATSSEMGWYENGEFVLPEYNLVGYNYRMTDIQGALGIAQMNKLDRILERRKQLAHRYNEGLKDIKGLSLPIEPEGLYHTYQSYVILIHDDAPISRNDLAVKLINKGISVRQGTHAVHMLGYYRHRYNLKPLDFPQSFKAHNQTLSLPLYFAMTEEEQDYVIATLKEEFRCAK